VRGQVCKEASGPECKFTRITQEWPDFLCGGGNINPLEPFLEKSVQHGKIKRFAAAIPALQDSSLKMRQIDRYTTTDEPEDLPGRCS